MANRIGEKFKSLRAAGKKALVAYLTAGDPSLDITAQLVLAFEKNGADIVELGVPFSDPLADGPTIQAASARALQKGVTLQKILDCVAQVRQSSQIPLALMTYYNPVFHFGETAFVQAAHDAGVDGVIIPDLPLEEAKTLVAHAREKDLATVFFLSPTTEKRRMAAIIKASTGFIYYVSVAGVTGARTDLPADVVARVKTIKTLTDKPVCIGFGVSSAEQVKAMAEIGDGVIVGSAIVKRIEESNTSPDLVTKVSEFVGTLAQPLIRN